VIFISILNSFIVAFIIIIRHLLFLLLYHLYLGRDRPIASDKLETVTFSCLHIYSSVTFISRHAA
jgi:hypothetical protein